MRSKRDKRVAALIYGLLAVLTLGAVVEMLPDGHHQLNPGTPDGVGNSVGGSKAHLALHAHDARQREVRQRFEQAVMMLHAKQFELAVPALQRVIALSPAMPEAYVNMGFALLELNQAGPAEGHFNAALSIRPEQANAYYGLAIALEQSCDLAGALGAMRTYLHLSEDDDRFQRRARAAIWEWASQLEASTQIGVGGTASYDTSKCWGESEGSPS